MCQEPTELLWIGCLTGLILILKIQIRYIDTKHQLADILSRGNFTRDEWNNLLHLFNISHFSSTCCAKNSSLISCPKKMAKNECRNRKMKRRDFGKDRNPTAMNLSSTCSDKFLVREKSDYIWGSCRETGKQDEKKFEAWRSAEYSSETERWKPWRVDGWQRGETCRNRRFRYYGNSLNLNPGAFTRMKWQVSLLHTKRVQENLRLPIFQKIQGIPKLQEGTGRIIFTYLRQSCLSWTKWKTSTWKQLFGECSWIPLFKLQFILVRAVIRIYDVFRTISLGVLANDYSKKLKNWSRTRQRSLVYLWLITKNTHGAQHACCVTEFISSRMPRPSSSQTQRSVWEV